MKKVLVLDTSILCVWLEVPGFNDCGPAHERWDKQRVAIKIEEEHAARTTFVLPLASLIETGNHIAQAAHSRLERSQALAELMIKSANRAQIVQMDGAIDLPCEWMTRQQVRNFLRTECTLSDHSCPL